MLTMPKLKSVKVADALEASVMMAKPEEQQRMPTLRALAERFSVSRQVIESAFTILEDRQVIVRRGRQGVWVNQKLFANGLKRIMIVFLVSREIDSFQKRVLRIMGDNSHLSHCIITHKIIPMVSDNDSAFLREVNLLRNNIDIDCLCFGASPLEKWQVNTLMELEIPLIFLGDFDFGTKELSDLPVNQMTADNTAIIDVVMEFCGRKGYDDIVVFSLPSTIHYNGIINSRIVAYCKEHGIKYRCYERELEETYSSSDEIVGFYQNAIADLKRSSLPDVLILSRVGNGDIILKELARAGISVPEDMHVISTDSESYLSGITHVNMDMKDFYNSLYNKIDTICENNNEPECTRLVLESVIVEMSSTEGLPKRKENK